MYGYSEIARADMTAGEAIGTLKNLTYSMDKNPATTEYVEILPILNSIDTLEFLWSNNRYLGFIYALRILFFSSINLTFADVIADLLIKLIDYEDTLFEYISSQNDLNSGLFKWSMFKKNIISEDAPSVWKAFLAYVSAKEEYTEIDFFNTSPNSPLLTEMSNALIVADLLLEFEQNCNNCDTSNIHSILKEVGALDDWRNL